MKMTTKKWKENEFLPLIIKKMGFCPLCNKIFADIKAHVSSQPVDTSMTYVCKVCKVILTTQAILNRHMIRHHPGDNWSCTNCEQRFTYFWQSLKAHVFHNHPKAAL